MLEDYPTVNKYFTVKETNSNFLKIDKNIQNIFFNLIKELEKDKNIIICTRGDSRINNEVFFTVEYIKKFFVVGQKADVFQLVEPKNNDYKHIKIDEKENILNSLDKIIKKVNQIIKNKPQNHNIKGEITKEAISQIKELDIEKLSFLKIIFISFLHNNGNDSFKSDSPFLSLTNGVNKFNKAKEFILNPKNETDEGYIFLYVLNKSTFSSDFIITKEFTKFLKKIGIDWYPDIHQEIMLLNGMYPDLILGIYEVKNSEIKSFYMNPELFNLLSDGKEFDKESGLPINKKNFKQIAEELGHKKFFFTHGSRTYISDLTSDKIEKTIDIQLGNN